MIARTFLVTAFSLASAASAEASGVYATLALPSAETCAQACEGDSLCMAWRFEADGCALRATVPEAPLDGVAGLSGRALAAGFSAVSKRSVGETGPADNPPAELAHDLRPEAPPTLAPGDALLGGPEPIDLALNGDILK